MSATSADRNLLFGVLAVQLNFVSHDDLIVATSRWMRDKQQPLSDIFVELGMLSRDESQVIDGVVQKHLERNNDDPRRSLESIEVFAALRPELDGLEDTPGIGSLDVETKGAASSDPYVTQAPRPAERAESKQRFTILRLHQKGGLGSVSIALDEELHREIALKEILPAHADNAENRSRFIREAEITGALEHPGVVPVYSLGQFGDGRPYYAMRFIRGVTLHLAIQDFHRDTAPTAERQLQFRQLVAKIIHVCHALEYAHSRGVIHRDIKPSNIMLGDYGETLVVDWGLAKTLDDPVQTDETLEPRVQTSLQASTTKTQIGRVVGTPSYMSPEQAAGRLDSLDATSDIFSLGATLYQVLTGQAPFRGNEEEVLGNVQLGRFDRPRKVNPQAPRALEAICLKAMARMPRERYQSAREMADDLERFLGDERVLAYHEPLPARAWRWVRNHKVLVTSTAATLTVAVTALTLGVLLLSAANLRERAERERAEENFAEATRQRNLAEKNFALARSAVHDYFVTVSEDTLLQQPGMQPLREELLRQALVYYQSFLEQRADDPELRQEVAEANLYAGTIVQAIESPEKALAHYEQASKIWKELLTASPDNLGLKGSYAQVLNAIGGVHLRAGRIEQAREFFQQSATLRQELAEAEPTDVESARTYANSLMNVGNTYGATDQWDRAVELFEQAQMIRVARLQTLTEPEPKLQRDLAMGYYNLAVVGSRLGEDDVAERNFLAASKIFEELLSAEPGEMSHQRNLAACYRGLADLKVTLEQPEEAVKYFLSAGKLLDELRIRNPEVHNYAFELAGVNINLARQYRLLEEYTEGLAAASRGVELLEGLSGVAQTMPTYRRDWGVALRLVGELLADTGDLEAALQRLTESQTVFSKLLQENPASEEYSHQLGLTIAAQEEVRTHQNQPAPEPTE